MKILILSPTIFEITPLLKHLEANFEFENQAFKKEDLSIKIKVSGVGLVNTAISTLMEINVFKPDLCILAGVCGSYDENIKIGEVLNVIEEQYGDLGVDNANGEFTSLFDLDFIDPNQFPFQNGKLVNQSKDFGFLKQVRSLSLQKSSGHQASIVKLKKNFKAEIENMEGAAFFQACLNTKTPFLEIRAVSNKVEPRNKENWNLPLAIDNLNSILVEMVSSIN